MNRKTVIKEQLLYNSVRIRKEGKTVGSGFLYVLPQEQQGEYAYVLTAAHIFDYHGYQLTLQVFSDTRNRAEYDFEIQKEQVEIPQDYSFGKGMTVFQEYDAAIVKIPYREWMYQCKRVIFGVPYENEPVGGIAYSSATTDDDIRYDYQLITDTVLNDIYSDSLRMRIQVKGNFYMDHSNREVEISGMSGAVIASDDENTFLLGLFVSIADCNGAFGKANLIKMDGHIQLLEKEGVKPAILDRQNAYSEVNEPEYMVISEKEVVSDWHFVHRENELSKIQHHIERNGIVVLTGIGGIGKTALARQYVAQKRDKYKAVHQISCKTSVARGLAESLRISALPRVKYGEISETDEEYGKRILQWLKMHEKQDVLYVFDDISPIDSDYTQVKALKPDKILTSRWSKEKWLCPIVEVFKLKTLEEQKALFCQYFERELYEEELDDFAEIASIIDGHSLTLALLAIHSREAAMGLERMKELLKSDGIYNEESMPFAVAETDEERTVYEHIRKILDFSSWNEDEKRLMAFLSLLPSEGMNKEQLKLFLGTYIFEVLNPLRMKGWIQEGFSGLDRWVSLHNVISEVVYREVYLKEEYEFDSFVTYVTTDVDHIRDIPLHEQGRVLKYGEVLFQRLKEGESKVKLACLLVNQYEYTRRIKEAMVVLECLKSLIKRLGLENSVYHGHYYNQMALIMQRESKMQKALIYFRKAKKIYKQCGEEAIGKYALALHNEARVLYWLGEYDKALRLEDEAEPLLMEYNTKYVGYVYDLRAHDYNRLADEMNQRTHETNSAIANHCTNMVQMYLVKELECRERAVAYKSKYHASEHEVMQSLAGRAVTRASLGDAKGAIEDIHQVLEFYKKTSEEDSEDMAHVYDQMCIIYENAGRRREACRYGELAVNILEKRLGKNAQETKWARYNLQIAKKFLNQ